MTVKFYYNGIKVDNGKLIKCFYSIDNHVSYDECVTIYAHGYCSDLPRDIFPVENNSDIYTDYFEEDRTTLTPDHPLYKFARYAGMKAAARDAQRALERGSKYNRDYNIKTVEAFNALSDPGQPTSEDISRASINTLEENKSREEAHEKALLEREKALIENAKQSRIEKRTEIYNAVLSVVRHAVKIGDTIENAIDAITPAEYDEDFYSVVSEVLSDLRLMA